MNLYFEDLEDRFKEGAFLGFSNDPFEGPMTGKTFANCKARDSFSTESRNSLMAAIAISALDIPRFSTNRSKRFFRSDGKRKLNVAGLDMILM